jgi:hypothetical protein
MADATFTVGEDREALLFRVALRLVRGTASRYVVPERLAGKLAPSVAGGEIGDRVGDFLPSTLPRRVRGPVFGCE